MTTHRPTSHRRRRSARRDADSRPVTLQAAEQTPTALWNDSADPRELSTAIHRVRRRRGDLQPGDRVHLHQAGPGDLGPAHPRRSPTEHPTAGESWIGWKAVEELSIAAAAQLLPAFEASGGRNGRLSMQTDPRFHRDQTPSSSRPSGSRGSRRTSS